MSRNKEHRPDGAAAEGGRPLGAPLKAVPLCSLFLLIYLFLYYEYLWIFLIYSLYISYIYIYICPKYFPCARATGHCDITLYGMLFTMKLPQALCPPNVRKQVCYRHDPAKTALALRKALVDLRMYGFHGVPMEDRKLWTLLSLQAFAPTCTALQSITRILYSSNMKPTSARTSRLTNAAVNKVFASLP